MLTSDEEISKTKKTHLFNDFSTNALSFLMNSSMALLKTCVKWRALFSGIITQTSSFHWKVRCCELNLSERFLSGKQNFKHFGKLEN